MDLILILKSKEFEDIRVIGRRVFVEVLVLSRQIQYIKYLYQIKRMKKKQTKFVQLEIFRERFIERMYFYVDCHSTGNRQTCCV